MAEFNAVEGSYRHPKRSNPTNHSQFSSTSMQDSSFIIPILPPELINEILLRLPVKTLLKFRCVSKSWLALISSPEFVKSHLSLSANDKDFTHHRLMLTFDYNLMDCSVSSLLRDSVSEAFDLEYPKEKPRRSVKIVGSVNGLICLATAKKYLLIWNPSIKKFKKLPDCRDKLSYHYQFMYGFGYDELHDDYKVVVGFHRNKSYYFSYPVKVKMYTMNSDSWTTIGDFHSGMLNNKSGIFVNGKLHWAKVTFHYFGFDIVSLDLADGKWAEVEQTYYGKLRAYDWTLGVLETNLSVFCNYQQSHTDVWVMKEYGVKESWIKMFTINIPCGPVGYQFCPFFCKRGILFQFGSTFMIYNPKDCSITHLDVTNTIFDYEANIYIESLVWPFLMEGTKDATKEKKRRLKKAQMNMVV